MQDFITKLVKYYVSYVKLGIFNLSKDHSACCSVSLNDFR